MFLAHHLSHVVFSSTQDLSVVHKRVEQLGNCFLMDSSCSWENGLKIFIRKSISVSNEKGKKKYGLEFYEKWHSSHFLIFKRKKGDPMVTLAIVQYKDSGGEIYNL